MQETVDISYYERKLDAIAERHPIIPLSERLNKARYVVGDYLRWLNPTTPVDGYATYVDGEGNRVYAYGEENRELVEVYGFNLTKPVKPSFGDFHEAHESNVGVIACSKGSMWSVYTPKGDQIIGENHQIAWIGDRIIGRTGSTINQIIKINLIGDRDQILETPKMGKFQATTEYIDELHSRPHRRAHF